jgi:hypothetical protein
MLSSKKIRRPAPTLEELIRAALARPFGPHEGHVKKWLQAMLDHGRKDDRRRID